MPDQTTGLLSPFLRRVRIKAALPHISPPVLDVGCGNGPLATYFVSKDYVGIDIDRESLTDARRKHAGYAFYNADELPSQRRFKTIVLLAVIEHVKDPAAFLQSLKSLLLPDGFIVMTTPHPFFEKAYNLGSRIGLFSAAAQQEHESLLDAVKIKDIAVQTGMSVVLSRRFLAGANQLFVLRPSE